MNLLASAADEGRRPVRIAVLTAILGVVGCFGAAFTFAENEPQQVQQVAVAR